MIIQNSANGLSFGGVDFYELKTIGNYSGLEGIKNLFSNVVTEKDIEHLERYNELVKQNILNTKSFEEAMFGASKGAKKLARDANGAAIETASIKPAADASAASLIGAQVAATALNLALSLGLSLAISGAVKLFDYLIHREEEIQKKAEELTNTINSISESLREFVSTTNEIIPRFEELVKGVDKLGNNISLTDDEYKEFWDSNNKIFSEVQR